MALRLFPVSMQSWAVLLSQEPSHIHSLVCLDFWLGDFNSEEKRNSTLRSDRIIKIGILALVITMMKKTFAKYSFICFLIFFFRNVRLWSYHNLAKSRRREGRKKLNARIFSVGDHLRVDWPTGPYSARTDSDANRERDLQIPSAFHLRVHHSHQEISLPARFTPFAN